MKVIVIGAGRLGSALVSRLSERGHEAIVIDNTQAAFNNLPLDFHGRVVEGDALNQDVLRRAGIEQTDALAAVTNNDSLNAVVAHVARTVFKVPMIVVRNYDPVSRPMLEAFNLQLVSSTSWGSQRIEELLNHAELHTVFSAGNGEVEVYEVRINFEGAGKSVKEIIGCDDCRAISVTRSGRAFIPTDDTHLQENDILHVSATFDGIQGLRERVCRSQEVTK